MDKYTTCSHGINHQTFLYGNAGNRINEIKIVFCNVKYMFFWKLIALIRSNDIKAVKHKYALHICSKPSALDYGNEDPL